jgi:hypothetical protein
VKSIVDARHLDEFVDEIMVCCGLFHLEIEQGNVLAKRESLPQIASQESCRCTASQYHHTFNELEEP